MSCSQCSCSQCASFRGSSSTCLDYCTDVETKGSNHENRSTLKRDRSPSTERGDTTESDSEDRFRLKRARPLPTGAADVQDSLKISNLIIHTEGVNIIQPAQFAFAVYKFGFIDKDDYDYPHPEGCDERRLPIYFVGPDARVFDQSKHVSDFAKLPLELIEKRHEIGIGGKAFGYVDVVGSTGQAGMCFAKLLAVEPVGSTHIICYLPLNFDKSLTTTWSSPNGDLEDGSFRNARSCTFGSLFVCRIGNGPLFSKMIDTVCKRLRYRTDKLWCLPGTRNVLALSKQAKSSGSSVWARELREAVAQSFFVKVGSDILMQEAWLGTQLYMDIQRTVLDLSPEEWLPHTTSTSHFAMVWT